MVLDDGKSLGSVARDLDLTESNLRLWVERARADRTQGRTGLTRPRSRSSRASRKANVSCRRNEKP